MNLAKHLKAGHIQLNLQAEDKRSALVSLLKILSDSGTIPKDRTEGLLGALIEREAQASTGLGFGVALPHARTDLVDKIQLAFGLSPRGVDFASLDGEPAHFFILVLAPVKEACEYLKVLSAVSLVMKDKNHRRSLLRARTPEDILRIFDSSHS